MQVAAELTATLDRLREAGLLTDCERSQLGTVLGPDSHFTRQLAAAESVHVHIKVEDTAALDAAPMRAWGGTPENEKDGYVKFRFPHGGHIVFSSRAVSEDDLRKDDSRPRPFLDHVGIDLRSTEETTAYLFEEIPQIVAGLGWGLATQGGDRPVYCCHVEVAKKYWAYPPAGAGPVRTPLEFAFGPLKVNADSMGCDLRPADPRQTTAAPVTACSAG